MLTGNQIVDAPLDYTIWNLDSIQAKYQVISQGGTLPTIDALPSAPMNFREPGAVVLNVEWVVVPGMTASPQVADAMAYQQFREAISQGVFTADEIAPLYAQWRDNLGSHVGLDSAPIYAIGIRRSGPWLLNDGVGDSITGLYADSFAANQGAFGNFDLAGDIAGPRVSGGAFTHYDVGVGTVAFDIGTTLVYSNPSTLEFPSNGPLVDTNVLDNSTGQIANATPVPSLTDSSTVVASPPVADLGGAVENLLSDHVIVVRPTTSAEKTQVRNEANDVVSPVGEGIIVVAANSPDDGGMIPVEELVGAVARESTVGPPTTAYVAASSGGVEIAGELTRATVMELIEGEADPAAPISTVDHVSLVSTNGANVVPAQAEAGRGSERTVSARAIKVFAEQAGLAASMMTPVNPVNLATIGSTVSDTFAAAALSLPSETTTLAAVTGDESGAARSAAFSQWSDKRHGSGTAARGDSNGWLDALPLLTMLACERVVAAKNQRQKQRQRIGKPAKAKLPFSLRRTE